MTLLDLGVRERIPDGVLKVADTGFMMAMHVVTFLVTATLPYGVLTGDLAVADAAQVGAVLYGITAGCHLVGLVRGSSEMREAGSVTTVALVVYTACGVGAALAPSPGDTMMFYVGIAFAGFLAFRPEWLATRLGFEQSGEEVAV